jgi:hypothetical protein
MPAPFEIRVLTINTTTWTPVTVPFDCTSLAVKNRDASNAVRMRTNSGDANTEDLIGPGVEQSLALPFHRYRFKSGTQPLWLLATSGTGPVVAKFLV